MADVVKVSVNLSQQQVNDIKRIADARGKSMTEVIRHAIALEADLQNRVADGSKIVVHESNGNKRQLLLLDW